MEQVNISTHNGTHVDAPWPYHSTEGGVRSRTIDELPLDWFIRPGVKLDLRHLPDGHLVMPDEIDSELARIGHTLQPFDIVVANTRAGRALRRGGLRRFGRRLRPCRHYLKPAAAARTDEAGAVMTRMDALPIADEVVRNARLRPDGRMVHDLDVFQVKAPAASKGDWDVHDLVSTIPGDQAFRPLAQSTCPALRKP